MAIENPFVVVQLASEMLGVRYAEHLARKGATIIGYRQEEEQKLTGLFRENVQRLWQEKYGSSLTDDELDSLEETFNKNFRVTLGILTGI